MKKRRKIVFGLIVLFSLPLFFGGGETIAQEIKKPEGYPQRAIEVIVPYGPGGGADATARGLCGPASKIMDVPMVYRYMPGGVATVGLSHVMAQPADGYTIYEASASDIVLGEIFKRVEFGAEELEFLLSGVFETSAIHARMDSKWKTIQQVLDYAKAHPKEKFTVAGADRLGIDDMFIMFFNKGSGIKGGVFKFIPFPSSGQRHASFLGGHITLLSDEVGDCAGKGRYKNKQIRTLVINGKKRATQVPFLRDVPTTSEIGIEIASFIGNWRILAVKKGTPPEIVRYLRAVFKKAFESPSWQKVLETEYRNLRPEESYLSGEQCKERTRYEKKIFTQILKEGGFIK